MPAKLIGLFLFFGGFLSFARLFRTAATGETGPRHRRIRRETSPWRFRFALFLQYAGAAICVIAGALCLVHFSLGG